LATDVDRLLDEGAAAAGNENLRRRAKTLRDLGKQVAALNPVADAVDKVTQATGKQVGNAFLDLMTITRQLRASLAGPGLAGDLKPAPERGPWKTPLSVRDLNPLYEALSKAGSGREETLRNAVEGGAIGDMRLLPALLEALGDGYGPITEMVAGTILPSLGQAALPDLQAALNLQGKAIDVRRLEAICRIDKSVGADLCLRAVKEGTLLLRAKALELIPDLCPPAVVEKIALEAATDKSKEVRNGALSALRVSVSDAALDALVSAAVAPNRDSGGDAFASLRLVPHPGTTARLLKELEAQLAVATAPPEKPAKGKPAPSKDAQKKADAARAKAVDIASGLMLTFGARKDGDRKEVARVLLQQATSKNADLREAALEGLGNNGPVIDTVLKTLIDALGDKNEAVVCAALRGLQLMDPAARGAAVAPVLARIQKTKNNLMLNEGVEVLVKHLTTHGKSVLEFFRTQLKSKDDQVLSIVYSALEQSGPIARPLLPDLLQRVWDGMVIHGYHSYSRGSVFTAIDPEGSESIPVLTARLEDRNMGVRCRAASFLSCYGPKAKGAIPALTKLMEANDYSERYWVEVVLKQIDR